ncbi:MAG: glycosyltransferase [Proteobacteria bacterium]|nr:glycosyltransferase [Pseudomonadota bacterium]MBU1059312.1 glycosyltransferase [Pseudomonadota bacterium]
MNELEINTGEDPIVSIVIPVYNEEACLSELIPRTLAACRETGKSFEILLVDDGSSDTSVALIKEAAERNAGTVIGVFLNRNYGQHNAIMAGLSKVRGKIIVTLDADLQNPPEEIPRLVAMGAEYDVVGTVRAHRNDSFFRKFSSSLVNKAVQRATGVMMHDYGCMLRVYKRHIVEAMLMCQERSTFIPVLANSFARTTTEIEVEHAARTLGESKYSFGKLISLMFDLVTTMTTYPLRLLSIVGGIISATGFGFGLLLLVLRLIYGAEWAEGGVFTLFALVYFFIGAQFIAMGLLGEYIGRIYHDVRARPRYFIQEIIGSQPAKKEAMREDQSSH